MIKLINISKKYNNHLIIDDLNITFSSAGLYIIEGLNGSGKSTLLDIISNSIKFDGQVIFDKSISHSDLYFQKSEDNTYDNISVINKAKIYLSKDEYNTFTDYLKKYELEYISLSKIKDLSSGEKQKIELLYALSKKAFITLLDEPFEHLDVESKKKLFKELEELSKSNLVIITSPKLNAYLGTIVYSDKFKIVENNSDINNEQISSKHKRKFKLIDYFNIFLTKNKFKMSLLYLIVFLYSFVITIASFIKPYVNSNIVSSTFNDLPVSVVYDSTDNNVYHLSNKDYYFNLNISTNNSYLFSIDELYGVNKVYFSGVETIIKDNEIYISDYLYSLLDNKDNSKLVAYGPHRHNEYIVKIYKTDYKDYLVSADPNKETDRYEEQLNIFVDRVNKYYNLTFVNETTFLKFLDSFEEISKDELINLINNNHKYSTSSVVDSFLYYIKPNVPISLLISKDDNDKYISSKHNTFYCDDYSQFKKYFDDCTPQEFLTLQDDDRSNDYKTKFTLKIGNTIIENMVFTFNATPTLYGMLALDYNSALKLYNENNIHNIDYHNIPKTCKVLDDTCTRDELDKVTFMNKDKYNDMIIKSTTLENMYIVIIVSSILFILTIGIFVLVQYKKESAAINDLYIKGFSRTSAFIVNYLLIVIISLIIFFSAVLTGSILLKSVAQLLGLLL